MKNLLKFRWLALTSLILASPAHAAMDTFDNSQTITSSALAATVTYSSVFLEPYSTLSYGGTTIENGAFENATGIIGIVQNTGANAVVQQAITVSTGVLNFDF